MNDRAGKMCSWRDEDRPSIKCRQPAEIAPSGEDFRCKEHWRKPWRGAGERARGVALKESEKRFIRERDHHTCRSCGREGAVEVDHIVEVADGGTNLPSNLQILCASCHDEKTRESRKRRSAGVRTRTSARNEAKKRHRRMGFYQQ